MVSSDSARGELFDNAGRTEEARDSLGAKTMVISFSDEMLGKPKNAEFAR